MIEIMRLHTLVPGSSPGGPTISIGIHQLMTPRARDSSPLALRASLEAISAGCGRQRRRRHQQGNEDCVGSGCWLPDGPRVGHGCPLSRPVGCPLGTVTGRPSLPSSGAPPRRPGTQGISFGLSRIVSWAKHAHHSLGETI